MTAADRAAAAALEVGTSDLALLYGVSAQSIADWRRAGMPVLGRGRYRLVDVVAWRRARDREIAAATSGPLMTERCRLLAAQTRGHELHNAQAASALLPVQDVLHDMGAYQRMTSDVLDRLADAAADGVLSAGADPHAVMRALRQLCRQARIDLAAAFQAHGEALAGEDAPAPPRRRSNGNGAQRGG